MTAHGLAEAAFANACDCPCHHGPVMHFAPCCAHHCTPSVEAATPVLREKSRRSGSWVSGGDGCGMNGAIRSDAVRVA